MRGKVTLFSNNKAILKELQSAILSEGHICDPVNTLDSIFDVLSKQSFSFSSIAIVYFDSIKEFNTVSQYISDLHRSFSGHCILAICNFSVDPNILKAGKPIGITRFISSQSSLLEQFGNILDLINSFSSISLPRSINELSKILASCTSYNEFLEAVLNIALSIIDADSGFVVTITEDKHVIGYALNSLTFNINDLSKNPVALMASECEIIRDISNPHSIFIDNTTEYDNFLYSRYFNEDIYSTIVVPIVIEGVVSGVLSACSPNISKFTSFHRSKLEYFAFLVGSLLSMSSEYIINKLHLSFSKSLHNQNGWSDISILLSSIFKCSGCSIFLKDHHDKFVFAGTTGIANVANSDYYSMYYAYDEGLTGYTAKHGMLNLYDLNSSDEVANNAPSLKRSNGKYNEFDDENSPQQFLSCPIIHSDKTVGVIRLVNNEIAKAFSIADEKLLLLLSGTLADYYVKLKITAFYESTLESSPNLLLVFSRHSYDKDINNWEIEKANEKAIDKLKLPKHYIGKSINSIVIDEDIPVTIDTFNSIVSNKEHSTYNLEIRFNSIDKLHSYHVVMTCSTLGDDPNKIFAICVDISERLKLQKNVHKLNAILSEYLEYSSLIYSSDDIKDTIDITTEEISKSGWNKVYMFLINDQYEIIMKSFHGFSQTEIDLLEKRKMEPEERKEFFAKVNSEFVFGESCILISWNSEKGRSLLKSMKGLPLAYDIPANNCENDWHPNNLCYIKIVTNNNRPIGWIGLDEPVDGKIPGNNRLRALEALSKIAGLSIENIRLAKSKAELLEDLDISLNRLFHMGRIALAGVLASETDHKVRKSVTDIDEYLYEMMKIPQVQGTPRLRKIVRKLSDTVLNMVDIINAPLDNARFEQPQYENISPEDVIMDAMQLSKPLADKRNASIQMNYRNDDRYYIRTEKIRFSTVITSLISNSLDAKANKIIINMNYVNDKEGYKVQLRIKDNGYGFRLKQNEDPFLPEYSTKKSKRGTGFGLFLSKSIMESLNGAIEIEKSSVNDGTVMLLEHPAMRKTK